MNNLDLHAPAINRLLELWLEEDIGRGDQTSILFPTQITSAHWVSKQKGVFCGGTLVEMLFHKLDPSIEINLLIEDGATFEADQKLLTITGPASALVAGERTALNLAMHLSGITTKTASLAAELSGTGIRLADTRKTTPGLRLLEKYAVRCGGGINHRLGLDDAAMLKENHIEWSKGILPSIEILRKNMPWTTIIIVEAETENQAIEAIRAGADGILLDEMSPQKVTELVPKLRELASMRGDKGGSTHITLEVSGVNPHNLKEYASTGVDLISTSAPVTQSSWIDFSMRFNENVLNG